MNPADTGDYEVVGTTVTGTVKQCTAQGFNGEGQDVTGYFLYLHLAGGKKLYTEKHPEGKDADETEDWLILLGEESPTLKWFEVEDENGTRTRYTVDVTVAAKVSTAKPRKVAKKATRKKG